MFDDEEEDQGFFLLVLGVLAAILLIVTVVAQGGDDLPPSTVTGPAPEETTTEAPTTTTEAPATTEAAAEPETTTTTEAPAPEPTTMWGAMNDSGQAGQFAAIGGALGLQAALESSDGPPRTLFAPSDEALAKLDPATINAIASDPARANALVGYHILPEALSAEELIALDGQQIQTSTGLPMDITVVDGEVVINGTSRVVSADFEADNGTVHIIETILTPPTVNQVIGLENIEFEVSSAVITAAGQAELGKAVTFFTENEGANAQIAGHTDTDGGEEGNLALSQARAESVKQFLVDNGIAEERLTPVGFGETQPILVDGVEDKAASRRIEFDIR